MNRRLAKEFRALRLPWVAGLAAGLAACFEKAQGWGFGVAFASVAAMAAMSLGSEYQQGTFALLLSQPVDRLRIWREKLLVSSVLAGTVALTLLLGLEMAPGNRLGGEVVPLSAACMIAILCSAGFWTMAARSIIGGMVFTVAGMFLIFIAANLGVEELAPQSLTSAESDSLMRFLSVSALLAYSGAMLWVGWRKFEKLQLREAMVGESGLLSAAGPRRRRPWGWLRIRPTGELMNLARKEVRLHRPLFVVGAVYVVCWLAALALNWLLPNRGYEGLYWLLTCIYVLVAVLLAGSISLGEERTLGLAAWHLTLPISARRQWLVKLAVAAAMGIGLAVALPGLLALATLPEARQQLHTSEPFQAWLSPCVALGIIFALSFWAATMLGNTMRAAVAAIVGSGALVLCFVLAHWCADQYGGLETGLFCTLTAWRHLPMGFFHGDELWLWWSLATPAVLVSLVALGQSLVQFRRAQLGSAVVVKCAALLLALGVVAAFWCADLKVSANSDYAAPLRIEAAQALCALPYTPDDISGPGAAERSPANMQGAPANAMMDKSSRVHPTVADLERVFPLSPRARRWLSGARLSLSTMDVIQAVGRYELRSPSYATPAPRQTPDQAPRTDLYGVVGIQFPNHGLHFVYGVWQRQDRNWSPTTSTQWVWD